MCTQHEPAAGLKLDSLKEPPGRIPFLIFFNQSSKAPGLRPSGMEDFLTSCCSDVKRSFGFPCIGKPGLSKHNCTVLKPLALSCDVWVNHCCISEQNIRTMAFVVGKEKDLEELLSRMLGPGRSSWCCGSHGVSAVFNCVLTPSLCSNLLDYKTQCLQSITDVWAVTSMAGSALDVQSLPPILMPTWLANSYYFFNCILIHSPCLLPKELVVSSDVDSQTALSIPHYCLPLQPDPGCWKPSTCLTQCSSKSNSTAWTTNQIWPILNRQ